MAHVWLLNANNNCPPIVCVSRRHILSIRGRRQRVWCSIRRPRLRRGKGVPDVLGLVLCRYLQFQQGTTSATDPPRISFFMRSVPHFCAFGRTLCRYKKTLKIIKNTEPPRPSCNLINLINPAQECSEGPLGYRLGGRLASISALFSVFMVSTFPKDMISELY